DHVGDLVEQAVVHREQRVQDAPLHRLAAVAQVGQRAVEDRVARVLQEVPPHERCEVRHGALPQLTSYTRLSTMKSRRAGVFLPMQNSRLEDTSDWFAIETGTSRMSGPMNCPNSLGEISPRPLKRVISAPLISWAAWSRSFSL